MSDLKLFNGRVVNLRDSHGFIAAKSKAHAVRIAKFAFGWHFSITELNDYWSPCWGNPMDGVPRDESGAWLKIQGDGKRVWKCHGSDTIT